MARNEIRCSFCGKTESQVMKLLKGPNGVYICDACGMKEAMEDMMDSRTPLTAWAIIAAPKNWRMEENYNERKA